MMYEKISEKNSNNFFNITEITRKISLLILRISSKNIFCNYYFFLVLKPMHFKENLKALCSPMKK